jgi:YtkA-like
MRATLTRIAMLAPSLAVSFAAACGSPGTNIQVTDAALFSCDTETRAVAYTPNLSRVSPSGAFSAVLVASDPGPPAKGTDTWTVRILDQGGAPLDGLEMTALPFMPDHGHGTSVKAVVSPLGGGTYTVAPLYLYMPGYWEVTLNLKTAAGTKDSVMFPICIPG